jgi:hypothetical protein
VYQSTVSSTAIARAFDHHAKLARHVGTYECRNAAKHVRSVVAELRRERRVVDGDAQHAIAERPEPSVPRDQLADQFVPARLERRERVRGCQAEVAAHLLERVAKRQRLVVVGAPRHVTSSTRPPATRTRRSADTDMGTVPAVVMIVCPIGR